MWGPHITNQNGSASRWPPWTGFAGRTLWDILALLIVPIGAALAGASLGLVQGLAQQDIQNERAQDVALQAYLDQTGRLLLERNLAEAQKSDPVAELTRARTITLLSTLDPDGKRAVLQFLYESDLISKDGHPPPVSLKGADLRDADLYIARQSSTGLSGMDLRDAVLSGTDMSYSNLRDANLKNAVLADTVLVDADLRGANLDGADLSGANLDGATMPDGSKHF